MIKSPIFQILHLIILAVTGFVGFGARAELSPTWPDQKDLTPESLVRMFADFSYELGEPVQDPEVFLQRKRGDCDDFATLVASTLKRHGFTTKIVVVMMERETHVVCYVEERKGYLDYNLRAAAQPIVACDGTLEDIARKVATSFRSKWHMASEIRYEGTRPVFVYNTFPSAETQYTAVAEAPVAEKQKTESPSSTETLAEVSVQKATDNSSTTSASPLGQ